MKGRERAFYKAAQKGCTVQFVDGKKRHGRITYTSDYTFGFKPDDQENEVMVFKGPGLVIEPDETPQEQQWRDKRSSNSSTTSRTTGYRPPVSRKSASPGNQSGRGS